MTLSSPDAMIAVYEVRPYWGPELQRQFADTPVVIRECRSLCDLLPSVQGFRFVLLVVDLEPAIEKVLDWLISEFKVDRHRWPIIACGSIETLDLEWSLREAGVTAFLPDVISGESFARLCRKQLGIPVSNAIRIIE